MMILPSTTPRTMHIGIDFDNTIVSYDRLFHRVCLERGWIPASLPVSKSEVRNYLRSVGREDDWTGVQGYVYGARMVEAEAFPGVKEFFRACQRNGLTVSIISHKTLRPYLGEAYDLHKAALNWLEQQGFTYPNAFALPRSRIHFEITKNDKLRCIATTGCTHFIDDLPEFLAEADFPGGVERILFDPNNHYAGENRFVRLSDWNQIRHFLQLPPTAYP
jgi:hypothetical protein